MVIIVLITKLTHKIIYLYIILIILQKTESHRNKAMPLRQVNYIFVLNSVFRVEQNNSVVILVKELLHEIAHIGCGYGADTFGGAVECVYSVEAPAGDSAEP